ncbi:hypothetical protein [Chelatococcus daeguensis]|uniref:hypothetical protein n=1 Tax=Chelatococcus daeguensis TaxID=444444 RepID=UPI0018DF5528|nr:hypothetical protein [Chelatococcus daeguensis]
MFLEQSLAAILGGIVAGVFTLAGAYWSLRWQFTRQQRERDLSVRTLCKYTISYVHDMAIELDNIYKINGFISYKIIDIIETTIQIFNRNMEHMIFVTDEKLREEVRYFLYEMFYRIQTAKNIQISIDQVLRQAGLDATSGKMEEAAAAEKVNELKGAAQEAILQIVRHSLAGAELKTKLQ